MPIWRLVLNKLSSYNEIETQWTFDDIMEANEILDIKEDIETVSMEQQTKGFKK